MSPCYREIWMGEVCVKTEKYTWNNQVKEIEAIKRTEPMPIKFSAIKKSNSSSTLNSA